MTIAMLLKNTLNLARHHCTLERVPLRRKTSSDVGMQANGAQPKPELGHAVVKVACDNSTDIWKQAVAMTDLREKMRQVSKSNVLPAVVSEASKSPAKGASPVSVVPVDPDGKQAKVLFS